MRISHTVFVATILFPTLVLSAAQSPANGGPPQGTATSTPTPSSILQPALDTVQQTIRAVKLEKWKRGTVREEADTNINAIQRDLQGTLPSLLKTADAAPTTLSKVLPVSRNVDALYDVLIHIVEASRVSGPADQVDQLQQAMNSLEKARVALGDRLLDTAAAQEKLVVDLRSTVQAQQASLRAAATPPPAPACPAPTPARKRKKTTSTTAPKTSAPPPASAPKNP